MKGIDLATLTGPLPGANPCGPDFEADDDDDYLSAVITTETVLPPEYFVFSDYIGARQPFDQDRRYSDLDIAARIRAVTAFVDLTHDLRLDILLAKLFILAKDLESAVTCIEAVAVLLETYWDEVHPRVEDGDATLRREVLQRLDDTLIVSALQHVPIIASKRHGAMTWHRYTAELRKNPGGAADELPDFDRSLAEEGQTDLSVLLPLRDGLALTRGQLGTAGKALSRIRAVCLERMSDGPPDTAALGALVGLMFKLVDRVHRLVENAIVHIDPSAASEPLPDETDIVVEAGAAESTVAAPSPPKSALNSIEEASAALAASVDYFDRCEPSNPGLLLLRQAQDLIGKSFFEAMQVLLPDHAAKAVLEVGSGKTFSLPVFRLVQTNAETVVPPAPDGNRLARPGASTREEAVALLDQVGAFFRRTEPSSPVPMLTEGARALTGKDFMTLLGDVLPKDTLKAAAGK